MSEREQLPPHCNEDAVEPDDAWARLVLQEYAPAVGALLRARYPVFNAEDIEDVVLIAMARLWKARDRFDAARASLKTFLFRIADNVARDVLKSGWYRARNLEVWLDENLVAGPKRNEQAAVASEEQGQSPPSEIVRDLRTILDQLPDAYRTIVLADACAPGRVASAEFLSQELQIPVDTVRVYRHRAMKAIRTAFEQAGCKLP